VASDFTAIYPWPMAVVSSRSGAALSAAGLRFGAEAWGSARSACSSEARHLPRLSAMILTAAEAVSARWCSAPSSVARAHLPIGDSPGSAISLSISAMDIAPTCSGSSKCRGSTISAATASRLRLTGREYRHSIMFDAASELATSDSGTVMVVFPFARALNLACDGKHGPHLS
jgi:hypothetical protein